MAQFVNRALREARRGLTEDEARLSLIQATQLAPQALHKLAEMVADDPHRRARLRGRFEIALSASGEAALTGQPLLIKALRYADVYDLQDVEYRSKFIYKHHPHALSRKLDPNFGYFSIRDDDSIIARTGAGWGNVFNLAIFTNYIPDLSATYPLPAEFEDEAITLLAQILREGLFAAKKNAAAN